MNGTAIIGWVTVAMFLVILADVPPTSDLAVAFAYLILISSLLVAGPSAMTNLQKLLETEGVK